MSDFQTYRARVKSVRARRVESDREFVDAVGGRETANRGDYVVIESRVEQTFGGGSSIVEAVRVVPGREFEEKYEPAGGAAERLRD